MGLAVGCPIISYLGWHATFFSILPIAVVLIVMVNRLIYVSSEEQESKSKLDFLKTTRRAIDKLLQKK